MGSGIAQTAASAGFETTVREVTEELLQKGFASIEKVLERFAAKERLRPSNKSRRAIACLERLHSTT